jgi:hypothetical protein
VNHERSVVIDLQEEGEAVGVLVGAHADMKESGRKRRRIQWRAQVRVSEHHKKLAKTMAI